MIESSSELVAIANSNVRLPTKRDLLLFDRFGVLGLDKGLATFDRRTAADLEWLVDQKVVFDIPGVTAASLASVQPSEFEVFVSEAVATVLLGMIQEKPERARSLATRQSIEETVHASFDTAKDVNRISDAVERLLSPYVSVQKESAKKRRKGESFEESLERVVRVAFGPVPVAAPASLAVESLRLQRNAIERSLRLATQFVRSQMNLNAAALLVEVPQAAMGLADLKKDVVIEIVLKKLPMPDDDTPLELIMDLRGDQELWEALQRLRHWMRITASSNASPAAIVGDLESALDTYTQRMRIHRAKLTPGVMQTFIVAGADVADGAMNLSFGKVARTLFELKDRHLDLTLAEMNTPGYELAYIVKVRERLSH